MKVLGVSGEPDTDSHGNLSAWITVEGVEGSVLLRKKAPFPQAGDDISDDYRVVEKTSQSSGKTYKKLERPQQQNGFGGGGPRPEDPKRAARIVRQHSQSAAIELASLAFAMGVLPKQPDVKTLWVEVIKPMTDVLDKDATGAGE